jgi:hypothetical protein
MSKINMQYYGEGVIPADKNNNQLLNQNKRKNFKAVKVKFYNIYKDFFVNK